MLVYNDEPLLLKLGDECVTAVYNQDDRIYPCAVSGELSLELLPNYNNIGIAFSYSGSDEVGYVYYKESGQCELAFGADAYPVFDESGVNTNVYMSTIFNLSSGTNYDVFVTFKDGTCGEASTTTRVALTAPPTPVRIRYVSPSGSGDSFTIGDPGSLDAAVSGLATGDEIRLMDGTYYVGGYNKLVTGIDNVTFINNSGDSPVINGSLPNTNDLTWSLETSGIYSTSLPNSEIYQVIVDDIRYYFREGGLSDLVNTGDGFYTDGSKLYIRIPDETSPSGHDVQVPEDYTGVSGFAGFITTFSDSWWFEGLTFGYYGNSSNIRVLYLRSSPEAVIRNCTFKFIRNTPIFLSSSPRSLVENNTFIDNTHLMNDYKYIKSLSPLPSTSYSVEGVGSTVLSGNLIGSNCRQTVVRNNNWTGCSDTVVFVPVGTESPPIQHCIDTVNNRYEFSLGEGIAPNGFWCNIRVIDNINFSSSTGLGYATPYGGPIYSIRNCCYELGRFIDGEQDTAIGQFSKSFVKWNSPVDENLAIASSFFYNNTFDISYSGVHQDRAVGDTAGNEPTRYFPLLVQQNNIFKSSRYVRYWSRFGDVPGNNYVFNNNILYSPYAGIKYRAKLEYPTSLAEWQAETGLDLDGIEADPLITGECDLDVGSPALNAAIGIRGISDWIGHNNIGAK